MNQQPKYRIYPSLLDKFQDLLDYETVAEERWNLVSNAAKKRGEFADREVGDYKLTPDEMYAKIECELINTINRCPKEPSEAADKGTAFNEIVDCLIENRRSSNPEVDIQTVERTPGHKVIRARINSFVFDFDIDFCRRVAADFAGSLTQFCVDALMPTSFGPVNLYGFIDEWVGSEITDIKTTSSYEWGKFERKWQRHLYPWAVVESGQATEITQFTYYALEWSNRKGEPLIARGPYRETYSYDHAQSGQLLCDHIEQFITWLEFRKAYITDRRIFGGVNPDGYQGVPITPADLAARENQPKTETSN